MSNKNKKSIFKGIVAMVIGIIIGLACGTFITDYIDAFAGDWSFPKATAVIALIFFGMYIAVFFQVIIHETGHLVFGLLSGYEFSSFRILSFMWVKENGKIKFKNLTVAGTVGQCLMSPPDLVDGKIPFVLFNLGGCFMNVIFSVIFTVVFFLCPQPSLIALVVLLFAVSGIMIALINGIPLKTENVDNDGYNTLSISKSPETLEAFWLQLKIAEQTAKGVCLKDMPAEWFAVPSDDDMKNSMMAARGVFACNRLMDEKRFEKADDLMKHLLEIDSGIIGVHRNLLICDRIYVELISDNRSEVIEAMLSKQQKKFMKAMKTFPSVLRTEYALALLFYKDAEKTKKIITQFEKCAKLYPYPNDIQLERELIEIAENSKAN